MRRGKGALNNVHYIVGAIKVMRVLEIGLGIRVKSSKTHNNKKKKTESRGIVPIRIVKKCDQKEK